MNVVDMVIFYNFVLIHDHVDEIEYKINHMWYNC